MFFHSSKQQTLLLVIHLVLLVFLSLTCRVSLANQPLKLGVLAYLPEDQILARYQPLADYLSEQLGNRSVEVLPLTYAGNQVENAIENNALDLLLTNPSHFIKLRVSHSLGGAMLTQVVLRSDEPVSAFGGVILTRADNPHINTLNDLKDKQIAAADPRSLGGYQAQLYETIQQGVELNGSVAFLKKHDDVVKAVVERKADVGFVRSGVLENMLQNGAINTSQIKVLNLKPVKGFPFALSTALYPEWPMLALPGLSDQDIRRVASALLALDINHPAAQAANIAGFNPPADYLPVDNLARTLRLSPYDEPPEFTLTDIWVKHYVSVISALTLLVVTILLASLLWRRNSQLKNSSEKLRRGASVFLNASEGVSITDTDGTIVDVNDAFEKMTGYSRAEIIGQNHRILKSGAQNNAFYDEMWATLTSKHEWQGSVWNQNKQGQRYAAHLSICSIKTDQGGIEGYVGFCSDITEKLYFTALDKIRTEAMQLTLEGAELSSTLDKILRDIESLNPRAKCSILLLDDTGKHLLSCSAPSLPDAYNQAINGVEIGDGIGSCGTAAFRQERVIVEDTQSHPYWSAFKELAAEHGLGSCWSEPIFGKKGRLLGTFAIYHQEPCTPIERDLSLIGQTADFISLLIEEHQAESDLERMATFDELTSLPNRRKFLTTLQAELIRVKRYDSQLSLCMIDLDYFKRINDQYGHDAGDLVLQHVASSMENCLREIDMVGRLGGEEFGVLLPNTFKEDALILAERIRATIEQQEIAYQDKLLHITASIGVCSLEGGSEETNGSDLLKKADSCLYYAKHNGRNQVSAKPLTSDEADQTESS